MAVRQDQVQIHIEFITDESRAFAKTLLDTKEMNKQLAESRAKLAKYNQQLLAVGADEAKRAQILAKISVEENKISQLLQDIAAEAKKVAAIDLTKLTPAQLTERARQLAQAMRDIPQSAPQFRVLEAELARINGQLGTLRTNAKGIKDDGADGGGGFFGSVVGKVSVAIAAVQGFFATLQGLFNFARTAVAEAREGARAEAALVSRIESTQGVAGRTVEQLTEQAKELQKVTFFTDEQTEKGQEILLTFTNIRGEIFDRTIPAAQDLSTVFGQDLQASAVQLGKALNDPVRGITALRRVGITFSEDQERTIKNFVETNRLAEAQAVILQEVERQVGGAARAAAEAEGGPYRLMQQRFGEVQEGIGSLISVGLERLRPAFEVVLTVLEKVTGTLTTGEAATGEYAGVANFLSGTLTGLGRVLGFLYDAWQLQIKFVYEPLIELYTTIFGLLRDIATGILNFIERAKSIPIVGVLFRALSAQIQLFKDLFESIPATFAGFRAAAQQAVDNVKGFFTGLILSARILAKELELALTIRSDARAQLTQEITALKDQQATAAAAAGKSIGEAYSEARNKALAEGNKKAAEEQKRSAVVKAAPIAPDPDDLTVGGLTPEDAAARRKRLLDADLKEVEVAILKREVVLENARLKDEISEREYQNRLVDLKKAKLEEQLVVYRKFRQEETVEALKVQNELLRLEQETQIELLTVRQRTLGASQAVSTLPGRGPGQVTSQDDGTADAIERNQQGKDALLTALRNKFEAALIAEQDYNLQRLEIQRLALAEEIAILQSATQPQVDEIRKRQEEMKKVEEKIGKERLENDLRLEGLRQTAMQEGTKAVSDVFQIGADLLSKDEKSKQKHASTVKALQVANVQVNLAAEVSGIFANAQKSAIAQLLGPVAGNILAGVQAALATVRAGVAIGKINAVKFATGTLMAFDHVRAKLGFFGGKPHSAGGTKGYFDDGTVIEVEKDEAFAVVNKHNSPLLRFLSNINALGGKGVPFFARGGMPKLATGGLPNINTTPTAPGATGGVPFQDTSIVERMEAAAAIMLEAALVFPKEVKSRVVYTEIEEVGAEVNAVREDAAI